MLSFLSGIFGLFIDFFLILAPGKALQRKFVKLGTLRGRSLDEIVRACGAPNSVSAMGDGNVLYQWIKSGYHIALIFDANEICLGVSSETSV